MFGPVGYFSSLFKEAARLIAWNLTLLRFQALADYRQTLSDTLKRQGVMPNNRHSFIPHLTICRNPESVEAWRKNFTPLPCVLGDLHLFESLGHSHYKSLWSAELLPPFTELEHTADIAYIVRGISLDDLFLHAQIALCFSFPPLVYFLQEPKNCTSIEEIVIELNEIVSRADQECGAPFKAVSFHGELEKKGEIYSWEMIIDV